MSAEPQVDDRTLQDALDQRELTRRYYGEPVFYDRVSRASTFIEVQYGRDHGDQRMDAAQLALLRLGIAAGIAIAEHAQANQRA